MIGRKRQRCVAKKRMLCSSWT